ncbi:hypothetical protein GPECTOR_27g645 [Gonium pectorale]|uniref:Uncharacterized protein n=1 Tax=Gonium pectorale TaxID=33097 RepID=A0A150GFV5_GONPE|nr:hypothetical protein GPECTOR_27g645 [Gonium pectorale]|eukprot:KXZ48475.1 hypothetical protein GPECTOR_27g645 [Gonium pectorale]
MHGRRHLSKLDAGADPLAADCDLETALHKAAAQGHAEAVRLLLSRGPAAATAVDKAGRMPAQRATGAAIAAFASRPPPPMSSPSASALATGQPGEQARMGGPS